MSKEKSRNTVAEFQEGATAHHHAHPSDTVLPIKDDPENLMNLLVQSVGTSVTNRYLLTSIPRDSLFRELEGQLKVKEELIEELRNRIRDLQAKPSRKWWEFWR